MAVFQIGGPVLLVLVTVSVLRVFLDDKVRPEAPSEERGRALFHHCFLAPDFVMYGIALLLSGEGIRALVAEMQAMSRPVGSHYSWFPFLIAMDIFILILSIVLWYRFGRGKAIPMIRSDDNMQEQQGAATWMPDWRAGFFSREGFCTLVLGNFLGLVCVSSAVVYITRAP